MNREIIAVVNSDLSLGWLALSSYIYFIEKMGNINVEYE